MTPSEMDTFLMTAEMQEVSVRIFCWMLAATGCRISEALSMTARNIDFEAKHVIIQSLKKRGKLMFRAVPLPTKFLGELRKWFDTSQLGIGRLWPWSRMTGYRRICEVMVEAGIFGSYASPKGLRHGFGVKAIQSNVPLTLVQKWLGHADIKTTAIYTSAMGPEEREIASRMWRISRDGKHCQPKARRQTHNRATPEIAAATTGNDMEDRCHNTKKGRGIVASDPNDTPHEVIDIPWFWRHAINVYCPLIQNWVKCHRVFVYYSYT